MIVDHGRPKIDHIHIDLLKTHDRPWDYNPRPMIDHGGLDQSLDFGVLDVVAAAFLQCLVRANV